MMASTRKRLHPNSEKLGTVCRSRTPASRNNTGGAKDSIPTLQELTGNMIRKQVEEERKDIIRKHSEIIDSRMYEFELQREELQRQLREVEEQMESVEIECRKDMLTELERFDNERQPEMLDVLTDIGQLDRICPLCEKYFRSSTELPACCLGPERCHLHTVQRCCFSCSRLSFHDVFQCIALTDDKGRVVENDEESEELGILETAASAPSWMLEQFFGEGAGLIGLEEEDEYTESAASIAKMAMRLVPSEFGSITCPVCDQHFCDHDFLYHFKACCRQAQTDDQVTVISLKECNE